jgi:hypothetical protein
MSHRSYHEFVLIPANGIRQNRIKLLGLGVGSSGFPDEPLVEEA